MLIARAEIDGRGPLDVRIEGVRVAQIGPGLDPRAGEGVLDAAGGALLPGLHDHHLHLLALAAAAASVRCGPPPVDDAAGLACALVEARSRAGEGTWIRGVGYHESVAGPIDRRALDVFVADRPLRIQHRSGAQWIVNSAGVAALGLDAGADAPGVERDARGRATGRLFRLDGWLRRRIGAARPPDLADTGRRLSSCGVTGLTDATPDNGAAELQRFVRAVEAGELPQRLVVMGRPDLPLSPRADVVRGAVKVVLHEGDLPSFDELQRWIEEAHAQGRPVAFHCVTRAELVLAATALAAAGARGDDRIEHAAVAPPDALALLAGLPLTVVTQPHFIRERGDAYAREVDAADRPWLYRCRGFLDASVPLGGGTDAPFGDPDPWSAMRAAVDRRTVAGLRLGAQESLTPERALALFTTSPEAPGGRPRRIGPGCVADLCLLDRPWSRARDRLSSGCVAATWRDGALCWQRGEAERWNIS